MEEHVNQDPPSEGKDELLGKLKEVRTKFFGTLQDASKQVTVAFEVADKGLKWCITDHAAKRGCRHCVITLAECGSPWV